MTAPAPGWQSRGACLYRGAVICRRLHLIIALLVPLALAAAELQIVFHRTTQHDGQSHLEQLWTIDLVAGRTVKFEPDGRHGPVAP